MHEGDAVLLPSRAPDARSSPVYTQDIGAGATLHAREAVGKLRPEELARPAALRPLLTLLGCGDAPVERLALQLLTALVDGSAEAAGLVRCAAHARSEAAKACRGFEMWRV